jgi:hypothetical protein
MKLYGVGVCVCVCVCVSVIGRYYVIADPVTNQNMVLDGGQIFKWFTS